MLWLVLIGVATGMRTMTPIAVFCWFAWLGLLPEPGWALWSASLVSVIVFTVFGLGEYIGDTLPQTPSRISTFPLTARIVFGAVAGTLAAHSVAEPIAGGVIFGIIGALIGSYAGFYARGFCAAKLKRDMPVALFESALALGFALLAALELHHAVVVQAAAKMKWLHT
jgi:uncharacterized membrane protein